MSGEEEDHEVEMKSLSIGRKILDNKQTVTTDVRKLTLLTIKLINAVEDIHLKPNVP